MDKKRISIWSNYLKFFTGKRLLKRAFLDYGVANIKGSILDIGAGWAPFSSLIRDGKVVKIDFDSKRDPDVTGSVLALPFKDGSFDSVICTEVLEHVPEPAVALGEIKRIMKPGGAIYLTAPMLWSLHYEPYDFYRYTKYGLKHLMEANGFELKRIDSVGGLFAFISMRFGEGFYNIINKIFSFLPRGVRLYAITPVVWPVNMVIFFLACVLDTFSRRDVFSWSLVAVKKGK